MQDARSGPKLGWYLLISLLAYAVVASVGWRGAVVELREARLVLAGEEARAGAPARAGSPASEGAVGATVAARADGGTAAPDARATAHAELAGDVGLWFPVPGARVPEDDAHLPGAPRPYRSGTSTSPPSGGSFSATDHRRPWASTSSAVTVSWPAAKPLPP